MFEELNKRRQAVAYNIAKSFENDIEKAIGAGYDLEGGNGDEVAKAHQVGDAHPNGKWVWTEYAPGKFDWRGIKKNATEKKQKVEGSGSKEVDDFMDKVKIFNNKYTDISKVSVVKTPKGNWDVSYDGHRLGIINADQLSEKTAKKNGWLREEDEKSEFEIEFRGSKYEYKGEKISEELVQKTFKSNKLIYSIEDKVENIKDIDENKEYNPEQIRDLFKYPDPDSISDKRWNKIITDFKDSIDSISGKVYKEYAKTLISSVVPFSLKYAKRNGKVTFSDFKVTEIGTLKEKIKSNNVYDSMKRKTYDFFEISYVVKTNKKKDIKIKTYLAEEEEPLNTRDIASFM